MSEQAEPTKKSIEQMLRDRQEMDQKLQQEFGQVVTVMFTDIKGSTSYFETYGDLDGRLMVQKHNDILFPIIEEHGGRIIKTIGDAIMALFEDAEQGVIAATVMQQALFSHNKGKKNPKDIIPVRIGLATGDALVEEKDVYGDVVNLASRVESQADAEEILIFEDTYKIARKNSEIICRFHKSVQVKGKEEPVKLYRVVWGDEEEDFGQTRSGDGVVDLDGTIQVLDVTRDDNKLKISLSERTAAADSAVRHYEEQQVDSAELDRLSVEILAVLQQASQGGKVGGEKLEQLKKAGGALLNMLLTETVVAQLNKADAGPLQLRINDQLVGIPWELLHTGEQFLSLKFEMGRIVSTRQQGGSAPVRRLAPPLKLLLIANPSGDLAAASREGEELLKMADDDEDHFHAELKTSMRAEQFSKQVCSFDICHFAGHGHHDPADGGQSGWRLTDDMLRATDVAALASGKRPMPALVFANACQSGKSDNWLADGEASVFGMANAFLLAGSRHFVGTFMDLPDKAGRLFSVTVYDAIGQGASIGHALHRARRVLVDKFGEDALLWAAHLLYGDPTARYIQPYAEEKAAADNEESPAESASEQAPAAATSSAGTPGWMWAVGAVAVIGLGFGIYGAMKSPPPAPVATQPQMVVINQKPSAPAVDMTKAIALYRAGKLDEALPMMQAQLSSHSDDKMAAAFLRDIQHQLALKNDQAKQKQIDSLVADLLTAKKAQPAATGPVDGWSSRKLAVTLLDMQVRGKIPLQDGAVEYIPLGISEGLQEHARIHVVDRALLDKILQELKLGSSELADPANQLKVGRLLSARALITGSIMAMGKKGRVSLRAINTETTEIIAQAKASFDAKTDPFELVDTLQQKLAQAILAAFPLRAVVTGVDGDQLTLSVGSDAGLKVGMSLEAADGSGTVTVTKVEKLRALATGTGIAVGAKLQAAAK